MIRQTGNNAEKYPIKIVPNKRQSEYSKEIYITNDILIPHIMPSDEIWTDLQL